MTITKVAVPFGVAALVLAVVLGVLALSDPGDSSGTVSPGGGSDAVPGSPGSPGTATPSEPAQAGREAHP